VVEKGQDDVSFYRAEEVARYRVEDGDRRATVGGLSILEDEGEIGEGVAMVWHNYFRRQREREGGSVEEFSTTLGVRW
jgi:hypothetical protein